MKNKAILIIISLSVIAYGGYYLGESQVLTGRLGINKSIKKNQLSVKVDNKDSFVGINDSEIVATPTDNLEDSKDVGVKNKNYFNKRYFDKLLKDKAAVYILNKSLRLFKGKAKGEDIAVSLAMSAIFDSSVEYADLMIFIQNQLNENSKETYQSVNDVIKNLRPEDSFIRGQLLSLVNGLAVGTETKSVFFGKEMSRLVVLDDQKRFTPDSLNITTSMVLLSQNQPSPETIRSAIRTSLEANSSPEVRKKLIVRIETYFPEYKDEISNY